MQQWENEKHPGLETALPSYNNSCAAARPNTKACHHDDAVYPPALLVAPMPEPKGRGLDKKAYAFAITAMLFAELILINAVAPQRSLVLATNPMTSLDVFAVGLYGKDPMWDDYDIAPSDGSLKGLAAVHIIAAVFTGVAILTCLLDKTKASCLSNFGERIWSLLVFVPLGLALSTSSVAWITDWAILQKAVTAGQDPNVLVSFSGGSISQTIAASTFALVVAAIFLAWDRRRERQMAAERRSFLPMPFKVNDAQQPIELSVPTRRASRAVFQRTLSQGSNPFNDELAKQNVEPRSHFSMATTVNRRDTISFV